ncbi:MAG: rod shape-determining protein MreC [Pseudomonadota bacterium]
MEVLGRDRRDGLNRGPGVGFGRLSLTLVSALLLLSSLYAAEASVFQKARESALNVAAPLLQLVAGPVAAIQDIFGGVEDYFFVLEQNKSLREQVEALRHWEHEARDLRDLINAYEALGYYFPPPGVAPVNAMVVGESGDAYVHSMIANAGRAVGVAPGQAVVDDRGLVGRVVDASKDASRILLLTDVQSNVPVYVDGSEVEGILAGRTTEAPAITFTRNDDLERVESGQRVVTSGAGGSLPRGLPVGVIAAVGENEAAVMLDANYARTRVVRIINYDFPTEIVDEPEEPVNEAATTEDGGEARVADASPAAE